MKALPTLLTLTFLALVPYSWAFPGPDGNPEHDAYAGQPGSVYDPAANPPQMLGTVTYNPDAVTPQVAPIPQAQTAPAPAAN